MLSDDNSGKEGAMGTITDVQTFKQGTIVTLLPSKKDREIYFIDKNNNGKLDTRDIKFVEIGTRNKQIYTFSQITRKDVRKYGQRISGFFKKAKEARGKLPKTVKPRKKGECVLAVRKGVSISATRTFSPPLTLNTRWYRTFFKILKSPGSPQNPNLCTRAVSTFKGIPGNAL